MNKNNYTLDDSICALATGWQESALAVIRCSGSNVIELLAPLFSRSNFLVKAEGNSVVYGHIQDPDSGELLDEVLATVFRAPKSYTGENSVEFSCHGALPGLKRILDLFERKGLRIASPGEFTFRSFINGKMDLTRAEAVQEIVSARTTQAQSLALNRLSGALFEQIDSAKEAVLEVMAAVSLTLDYPDDEVEIPQLKLERLKFASEQIDVLLSTFDTGRLYQEGIKIVLAGKTNAGKSSLFNLLLKEERSIVSDIHGTTRDWLESWMSIKGIPVRLYDTAGLRDADNPVEKEGIKRTENLIENCDIVLNVVDGTVEEPSKLSADGNKKHIYIWNKSDISEKEAPNGFITMSAESGLGLKDLEDIIVSTAMGGLKSGDNSVVIDSIRQKQLLERAKDSINRFTEGLKESLPMDILSEDLKDTLNALGEITGEVSSSDILETMFSKFCVGK